MSLPDDDPVYTLKKVMEEMDFSSLMAQYSNKGRNGYNPIMKYAVLTYANMRGVKSVDRIVELCERDLAFIWLTKDEKTGRDAVYICMEGNPQLPSCGMPGCLLLKERTKSVMLSKRTVKEN